MMDKEIRNKVLEIRILEEQIKQLEQEALMLDQKVLELQTLQNNLDEIKKTSQQDILVPLGNGIFINSKIEPVKEVLINIGAKIIAKKEIGRAKEIVDRQKNNILEERKKINRESEKILEQIEKVDVQIRNLQK